MKEEEMPPLLGGEIKGDLEESCILLAEE